MSDEEFEKRFNALSGFSFREDFEAAIYELYVASSADQRERIRGAFRAGKLEGPSQWKNPTDYERADLTRNERIRRRLILLSIRDGTDDFREDLWGIAHSYHNLLLRGVDADRLLNEIADLSAPKAAELFRGFVRRKPEEKSLKAWALQIVQMPDGPIADHVP